VVTTLQRFDLAMATRITVAPDGRRLALSTLERIEVRSLDGQRLWSYLDPTTSLQRVVWDGPDRLLYAQAGPARITEVDLATGTVRERGRWPAWDRWLGRLGGRDVLIRDVGAQPTVASVDPDGVATQLAAIDGQVSVAVSAPGGRRMALMIERRYDGKIVIIDGGGEVARSQWLSALTAVAWLTDDAVVYATGTVEAPTLWRTRLVGASLTPGREIYRGERGWFGQLSTGGERLFHRLRGGVSQPDARPQRHRRGGARSRSGVGGGHARLARRRYLPRLEPRVGARREARARRGAGGDRGPLRWRADRRDPRWRRGDRDPARQRRPPRGRGVVARRARAVEPGPGPRPHRALRR
jgi:hypothetical protein